MAVHRLRRLSLLQRPHNHLLIRRTTSQALPSPTWTPSTSHRERCPPRLRTRCVPAANRPARSSPFCSQSTGRFRHRSPRRAAWTRRKRAFEWAWRDLRLKQTEKAKRTVERVQHALFGEIDEGERAVLVARGEEIAFGGLGMRGRKDGLRRRGS